MITLAVRPLTLFRVLVTVALVLLGLSLVSDIVYLGLGHLDRGYYTFDLDQESNVPTWWASLQEGLLGLVCLEIGRRARARRTRHGLSWLLLGVAMLFVSADEIAGLHEQLSGHITDLTGRDDGIFRYGWVLVALPVVVVFVLAVAPMMFSLPRTIALELVAGGFLFVLGSAVLEAVGGSLVGAGWSETSWPVVLEYTVEETFELLGVAIAF
ncbi:MAG: hypothetical protein ACRYF3_17365, partial [Janthinobacterium lividum]